MTPVNTKSLFAHLCMQMEKLDKGEIDASTASAQAKLAALGLTADEIAALN